MCCVAARPTACSAAESIPLQLYVSMVAMSYFHISNGPTLSHLFSTNLSAGRWRNERPRHAHEMLKAYLTWNRNRFLP